MKLAEALAQRNDLHKRLVDLKKRLRESARVQEGDDPPEEPRELLAEARSVLVALRVLQIAINRSNVRCTLPDGQTTLMEAIAQRDLLREEVEILTMLAEEANPMAQHRGYRITRSEVRLVPTIDLASLYKQRDERARAMRDLHGQIQATNWTADLLET